MLSPFTIPASHSLPFYNSHREASGGGNGAGGKADAGDPGQGFPRGVGPNRSRTGPPGRARLRTGERAAGADQAGPGHQSESNQPQSDPKTQETRQMINFSSYLLFWAGSFAGEI